MIGIGIIGCGYWGPNLLRNFYQLPDAKLLKCSDLSQNRLDYIKSLYHGLETITDYRQMLQDPEVQAVVIATPASSHYQLAKESLECDKDVLVEKPLTLKTEEAEELVNLAERRKRILMVGHTFEYNPAVRKIKEYLSRGEMGEVYYIYSNRVNLGRVKKDISALWNIAPHDISILIFLLEKMPSRVSASGACYLQKGIEDVVFLTLKFPDNVTAYIQASWLDPSKVRKMTIVGSKRMIIYDDIASEGKIKIYDKGVLSVGRDEVYGEFQFKLHSGDIQIPKIDMSEPLKNECQHFLQCVKERSKPLTGGESGVKVIKVLEAAQDSLRNEGAFVEVKR